ncbi:CusA/CzcA family heavy metal efflux RND transporter [Bizionia gelidisalsuginis]|uniref:CusA/CzcA family heavy metal efflux RND transporter n=1 Tax=Bizionia gelidisalsuginis TaxID=291188 RepID=A0ABY3M995_9FLAO|nr:CusA/CzcA family heavy metal efflux RND transporter [Bizionia gelidisalsuginis]TYC11291.1 CusA/CzcA family heavy metal efflux RND transporter [Bizionia gelidisalsuginis]
MINKLIAFSINNKIVIALLTLALIAGGVYSILKVPIGAVPDITNNQVQIITQAPNLGTEDIEQFVTYPVELAVANLPEVKEIRSVSRFGLSVVTIVFNDNVDTYLPRQLVSEKLTEIKAKIPEGFGTPFMGPISTGLGEIYQYTLEVAPEFEDRYTTTELRTIQDWIIRRQMAMVPGVVEVNAFGGGIKQYEVAVNPSRLKAIGISINDVFTALQNNNQNTGGAYIEKNHQANFIRGEGLARTISDINKIVVTNNNGIPVTIEDIADVNLGTATRYGALTKNGEGEAVGGMILMLKGASSNAVIENVTTRIESIQKTLPEGITIKPFLDRSKLIANTTSTVQKNLVEGALIVIFILIFFLGSWRGGLIVASTIPLSLLFAFILMYVFDVWANLMSLGAIDFGIIVDGAVIIVESTVFLMYTQIKKGQNLNQEQRDKLTFSSSSKMMNTAFFGQFIILIVFLPILALEGIEGKMFRPMALTFIFAMIGAMILCLTYVPMVTSLFLKVPENDKKTWGDKIVFWLENKYENGLVKAFKRDKLIIATSVILLAISSFMFTRMGGEFIPQLDEGDLAFHVVLKPGSSLSETISATTKVEKLVKNNFPEVKDIISRIGVAEVPTDPMPMDIADVFVILKPQSEWVSATNKEELISKMKTKLETLPGLSYEFSQPIEMRFNELITGVREDIAIKLYGDDLTILSQKAEEIGKRVSSIPGVADMKVEATVGQPQITINYNRNKIAQYGLQISDLNTLVETAFAGGVAGTIFEGERRFDLVVRVSQELRQDLNSVKNLFVSLPNGAQIALKEVADISFKPGPMQISRDNTNRRVHIGINVRGRDVKSLVEEIQEVISTEIMLPSGYYIRYGGAFENLERATNKLKTVVPISLLLIFVLIFFALKSIKQSLMIYMAIPLAAIGGVFSLLIRDMPFSISAGVGFIVLFGVAVLNGLVLISGFNELKEEGVTDISERIKQGTKRRIRPILLTALTDMLGFLPMALSTSSGSEVQRPLATVVIGGLLTATLLTLFVIPILYRWIETREANKKPSNRSPKTVLASLVIVFGMFSGSAQTTPGLSMEEAVRIASTNHPALNASTLSIKKEEALKTTAWDFGETSLFTSGEEIGYDNPATYTRLGIGQTGIAIFEGPSKVKLAKNNIALAQVNYEVSALQVEQAVKKAWIKTYISKRIYDSYATIDSTFSGLEKALTLRYETEAISKLEYNATSNQGKLISIQKRVAYNNYKMALEQFNQHLFSATSYSIKTIAISELERLDLTIDSTLKSHPLLRQWTAQLAVANAKTTVQKASYLPKLSAQYGFQEVAGQTGFNSFQIGLKIPLIFNVAKGKSKAAQLQSQIIQEENRLKTNDLNTTYTNLVSEYTLNKNNWNFYKTEALELAIEQREGATLSYKEGAMDYIAFIQTLKDATELEINTWNILESYLMSTIAVDFFMSNQ